MTSPLSHDGNDLGSGKWGRVEVYTAGILLIAEPSVAILSFLLKQTLSKAS